MGPNSDIVFDIVNRVFWCFFMLFRALKGSEPEKTKSPETLSYKDFREMTHRRFELRTPCLKGRMKALLLKHIL